MNKTFTVFSNKHCSFYDDGGEQDQLNNNKNRFCTFTKCKIKQQSATVIVNQQQQQQRYFDSPTMILPDDDDLNEDEIPISRCSNKISITATTSVEPNLNETALSDLLVFTNPNRILTESMQVVISRHPSLEDLKYINDVSSILVGPSLYIQEKEEPVYQELIRMDHLISTPPADHMNDVDENKENRPPLMPIKYQMSHIPIWTPSPANSNKVIDTSELTGKNKKHEEVKKKVSTTKPSLTADYLDILDEWSCMAPKLKELLSNTRKMPLRIPQLTKNSVEFRRLKQLLTDMEVTTSSWTNAINQCRYVLQHAQQQLHRS